VRQETAVRTAPTTRIAFRDRIAGAPVSWGVCEVPGWGHQLDVDTVLGQMRDLGLAATEFGPEGYLPDDPATEAALLASYGLRAVGGFLPAVLHQRGHDPLPAVDRFVDRCLATGAEVVVLAAASGGEGYDVRPVLDEPGWTTLLHRLDRLADHVAARGVLLALHPHVGTMVETADEVERVVRGSRVGLCIDTGHLLVGGSDPVAVTAAHADRVVHVHLKDVDAALAARVRSGSSSFGEAVRNGVFRPLGDGDVDVASLVRTLEEAGYLGWYVLEQDVRLAGPEQAEAPYADVRRCLDYLARVAG